MDTLDYALWWQIYPLGACGTDMFSPQSDESSGGERSDAPTPDGATPAPTSERGVDKPGKLRRLEAWLDYAIELGCSGILLGPIFESTAHGYDTTNHLRIDPRLGSLDDFDHLMGECSKRGLKVMLDGVFNHVGTHHPLVTESIERARAGAEQTPVKTHTHDGEIVSVPWEGNLDLAELDHSDPRVADMVVDIMEYWLDRGITGWRLDAAYSVPTEFWRTVIDRVRDHYPDAVFVGEIIHGEEQGGYIEFAAQSHMDSITQYEVWQAIWSSIKNANMWELDHALGRHQTFVEQGSAVANNQPDKRPILPLTFIGNHDVSRIASVVGDNGAVLAAVAQLMLPGMPSIYYGDEQGFRGEKQDGLYADADIRPPLPDSPADLLPTGEWLHEIYQRLIGIRRDHPWIARGDLVVENVEDHTITFAVTGQPEDDQTPERQELQNPSPQNQTLRTMISRDPDRAVVTVNDEQVFYWEQQ
ncbi:alpha-amylase family protein [Corynebacterium parakroppenstedtii]|uniref:alpha-amylase family protein n=1 Tax=Corynebacterium parakroppenstedtii TaxID=2828363 RepID=UPI001FD62298|nr:alpha-amylase family protein [Corynebacterium parakroppenstedtii]